MKLKQLSPLCFVLLLIFSHSLFGQANNRIKVLALSNKAPIPFASITSINHHFGFSTDSLGTFLAGVNLMVYDTLVVGCVGYVSKKIPTALFKKIEFIALEEDQILLDPIKVTLSKKKIKYRMVGSRKRKQDGSFARCVHSNAEMGLFIPNTDERDGFFTKVYFHLALYGANHTPYRQG